MRRGLLPLFLAGLTTMLACGCATGAASSAGTAPRKDVARKEGVRPAIGVDELDPRGLEKRWDFFLGEEICGMWALDDALYVYTARKALYALGLEDGFVRWQYMLGDELSFPPGTYSYRKDGIQRTDELYLVSKDVLHVLDRDHGYLLWKLVLPFAVSSPPAGSFSHIYLGSWDNRLYAVSKEHRMVGWTYRTGQPITARPEAAEKTVEAVFFGSEDGTVYSFSPVRDERKWSYPTLGAIRARPLFFRNFLYVGSTDFNLYCIRTLDGNLEWRYPAGAPITREPIAFTRDTIFVIVGDSTLLALNLQPDVKKEYLRWSFEKVGEVLAKGRRDVYVRGLANEVIALAEDTGKPRWEKPLATGADFFVVDPYDPGSLLQRERRLASTIVLGYRDGWLVAVREKREF